MLRIKYFKVTGNTELGDLELNFSNETFPNEDASPYNTVIIGPNGTGKSYILRTLILLFRELYELKTSGKRKKIISGGYIFEYYYNNSLYYYGTSKLHGSNSGIDFTDSMVPGGKDYRKRKDRFYIYRDGTRIRTDEIQLPESILASSIMLTDKFIYLTKPDEFRIYKYLGIRSARSSAGTRAYIRNTITHLANSTEKSILGRRLLDVLEFLELEKYLRISYGTKRRDIFFTGQLTTKAFMDFVKDYNKVIEERRKKEGKEITPWYALRHYESMIKDEIKLQQLVNFCNTKAIEKDSSGNHGYVFTYDVIEEMGKLEEDIEMIGLLEKLNLIDFPKLSLKKQADNDYEYEGASSGEAHFLSSVLSILATIMDNSLVLIDEPEISLHPNWQMKYMHFLRETFKDFSNCHFIIATHSHFLLSDLKGESSTIIGLNRKNGNISETDLPKNINTYGWSSEEILYSVFNVKTVRNYFLEQNLTELLGMIGVGSQNFARIGELVKNVERLPISEDDPLKDIINEANEYLKENDHSA